jgi:hypothetical protein
MLPYQLIVNMVDSLCLVVEEIRATFECIFSTVKHKYILLLQSRTLECGILKVLAIALLNI